MNTYQITTIKDIIDQIPTDKLEAFFKDMHSGVVLQQVAMAMTREALGDEARGQYLKAMGDGMEWVDDGKDESIVSVRLSQHEVAKVAVEYKGMGEGQVQCGEIVFFDVRARCPCCGVEVDVSQGELKAKECECPLCLDIFKL